MRRDQRAAFRPGIDYVEDDNGCWIWQGHRTGGYGSVRLNYKKWRAHRLMWTLVNGPIPDGMTVDHLCYQPSCCNVAHLRLLTASDNSRLRRNTFQDFCGNGHEWTPSNIGYRNTGLNKDGTRKRYCRACAEVYRRRTRAKDRFAEAGSSSLSLLGACCLMLAFGLIVGYLAVSPFLTLDLAR